MNKRSKSIVVALLALLLAAFLAIPHSQPVEAAAPKLNKTKITLAKGAQSKLKVTGTKAKVKWSTDKRKVATVTSKGVVTAKGKGTARITAKVGKRKLACKVTVETPKISNTRLTLAAGKTATLRLTGTKGKVKWNTSDKSIATVTQGGVVRGVRAGNCRVYAKVNGGAFYCAVRVNRALQIIPRPTHNPIVSPTNTPTATDTPTDTPTPTNTPPGTIIDYDEALARNSLSCEYYEDGQKINVKVNNGYKYILSVDISCVFYGAEGERVAKIGRRFLAIPSKKSDMCEIEYPRYSNGQIKEYEQFEIIYDSVSLQTDYSDRMVSCTYELKEEYIEYTLQNNLGKNTEEFGVTIAFYKNGRMIGHCSPAMYVLDIGESLTDRANYITINGERPDLAQIMIPMIHKNQNQI